MNKTDIYIFGILIIIVIVLFIAVYHNNKITYVSQVLKTIDHFDASIPTNFQGIDVPQTTIAPTAKQNTSSEPELIFKNICGDTISGIYTNIPFPNSDDYHILVVNNVPPAIYNADKILVSFGTNITNDIEEYTGAKLKELKTSPNRLTIKKVLLENLRYVFRISTVDKASEIKFLFVTGYNTFTYNPITTNKAITDTNASEYLMLGLKQKDKTLYTYQPDSIDSIAMIPIDGNYTYNLQIPDFNRYIAEVIKVLKGNNSSCLETEINELSKYIPYKFDAVLSVDRIKDSYPLETVILPSIKCIPTGDCMVIFRNLRKNTTYKVKIRLIYFKVGSVSNYRSTPMISLSFNTGDSGDNFFETLDQINKLIKTVKNNYVNIDIFNKDQDQQNSRLNTIENNIQSNIRPIFK